MLEKIINYSIHNKLIVLLFTAGIIGFGLSGRVFHGPLISAHQQLNVFAIASSRKQEIADAYPQALCLDSDTLINHPNIDIVVIASPNSLHAEQAEQAMLAGKHVIVEKPLAITSEQCLQLQQIADQTGKCLSVFHNRRWDSDFLTISQLLASQNLGRIHSYKAFEETYKSLVKAGIDNISIDVMFGLSDQTMEDWLETLDKVIHLNPKHISAYSLIIEEDTEYENGYKKF